jgi:hypothetical protein
MAMGSRLVLSPVETLASNGGSRAAMPPPSSSDDSISESTPHEML